MLVPLAWRGCVLSSLHEIPSLFEARLMRKRISEDIKSLLFTPNPCSLKIEIHKRDRHGGYGLINEFRMSMKSKELTEWKTQSPSTNVKRGTRTSPRPRVLRSWSISGK